MDTLDVLKVCLRRWYVVLPVVMVALGVGFALAKDQQPDYHARATFAFVFQNTTPGAVGNPQAANPLANTDLLGTALAFAFENPEWQEKLGDPAAKGVPTDQPSDGSRFALAGSAYTYAVDSWAPTSLAAQTTVQNVMDAVPGEVKRLQVSAGAPAHSLSTVFVMSPTRVEVIPAGSGLKMLIALAVVGVIAGAALSIALEALLGRRPPRGSRHRSRMSGPPDDPDDDPEPGVVTVARAEREAAVVAEQTTEHRAYPSISHPKAHFLAAATRTARRAEPVRRETLSR